MNETLDYKKDIWRLGRYDFGTKRVRIIEHLNLRNRGQGGGTFKLGWTCGDLVLVHKRTRLKADAMVEVMNLKTGTRELLPYRKELANLCLRAEEPPRLISAKGSVFLTARRAAADRYSQEPMRIMLRSPRGNWREVGRSIYHPNRGKDGRIYFYSGEKGPYLSAGHTDRELRPATKTEMQAATRLPRGHMQVGVPWTWPRDHVIHQHEVDGKWQVDKIYIPKNRM
ncbi:MAG: hypothetical protein V3W41_04730 [Planctomycetota bacterium]